jgi:sialidase-1
LFVSGQDGFHTYRIPALAVTRGGVWLAFCEGRRAGQGDSGAIALLLKRSTDGGKTWGAQQTVWADGKNTWGNPAPVVDRETGVIWLLCTWNRGDDTEGEIIAGRSADTRRVSVMSSADEGASWELGRVLQEGPSAYSDLADLGDGLAGCLYERGDRGPYETITLALFPAASTAPTVQH